MPSGYWSGLVEGFQGRRASEEQKNLEREQANRQMSDRVFSYLLQSRDPRMQELALNGLMNPLAKKKGFAGFMGEYESNPMLAQIVARMNEMVPGEGQAPPTQPHPAAGQSAAMSTNAPVEPGSAPITPPPAMPGQQLPPEAPPAGVGGPQVLTPPPEMPGAGGGAPQAGPGGPQAGGMPMPSGMPMAPQESRWKRRGTGVPTAEEIAESNARIPLETKLNVARQQLQAAGLPPEEIQREMQRLIEGALGAPQNPRQFAAPTFGVKLPNGHVSPVSFDYTTGTYTLADGKTPYDPNTMEMIPMRGGAGAGGSMTTKVQDTPAMRQQLIAQGADADEINAGSPTGYWKVRTAASGEVLVAPDMFTPPPTQFAQGLDTSGNNALIALPRNAPAGTAVATAPGQQQPSEDQTKAQALLEDVKARVRALEVPEYLGAPKHVATSEEINRIVAQAAREHNLPYTTFYDLQAAVKAPATRQITPRANAPKGTAPTTTNSPAQNVLEYILQQENPNAVGGAPTPPPPKPATPGRGVP